MTVAVVTRIMPEKRANAMQEANRMGMEKGMGCSINKQAKDRPKPQTRNFFATVITPRQPLSQLSVAHRGGQA